MHIQANETPACVLSGDDVHTAIRSPEDVLTARQLGRYRAISLGFGGADVSLVAAAISEVARNIVEHAKEGTISVSSVNAGERKGMKIVARDAGPGIPDVESVTQYGLAPRVGLGMGLPGARLLVDEFDIVSGAGRGTTVTMTKWVSS
jgi:serine/threonine-protein kinase RsbT